MELSAVAQDYLKVLWSSSEWSSEPLTTKALAERLGVTPGTVSEGVRRLADAGLVDHPRYRQITLTEQGRLAALAVVRRHRLVETLLVRTFGYTWDEVHEEAEVLEHAVSDRFVEHIDAHLGHPTHDPHGDPIPTADGEITIPQARPLAELAQGECGVVTRVSDADGELLQRLAEAAIVPGRHVVVEQRDDASALVRLRSEPADAGHGTNLDSPPAGELSAFGLPALHAVWVVPG